MHSVAGRAPSAIRPIRGPLVLPTVIRVNLVLDTKEPAGGGTGQVLVAVIGGVPLDYPETGMMLFQDSDMPEFT